MFKLSTGLPDKQLKLMIGEGVQFKNNSEMPWQEIFIKSINVEVSKK